jgi:hypothetical protein
MTPELQDGERRVMKVVNVHARPTIQQKSVRLWHTTAASALCEHASKTSMRYESPISHLATFASLVNRCQGDQFPIAWRAAKTQRCSSARDEAKRFECLSTSLNLWAGRFVLTQLGEKLAVAVPASRPTNTGISFRYTCGQCSDGMTAPELPRGCD